MDQPLERPKMTPKDFFLYLGVAISLYASAGSLLGLLFAMINARFADALDGYWQHAAATSAIQFSTSVLIVAFPVFLGLSWYVRKEIMRDVSKYQLSIRKWFVWLTLFVAGATIAGDVIALINTYMGGEISIRFVLKMLSVLVVAAAIFGYYFYDLRRAATSDVRANKALIVIAALAILVAIVCGFMTVGSPANQRALRMDSQRVSDLQGIQGEVLELWRRTGNMPQTLQALEDDFGRYVAPTDPETQAAYEYVVTGPLSFELCATFSRESATEGTTVPSYYDDPWTNETFTHGVGRTCFERTIDPVRYPPYQK